jgi:hypothetical protein
VLSYFRLPATVWHCTACFDLYNLFQGIFCTLGSATRESVQVGFVEEYFKMRNHCEFDKDATNVNRAGETKSCAWC